MSLHHPFEHSLTMVGAGDVPALERPPADHPELARGRPTNPGPHLSRFPGMSAPFRHCAYVMIC
jgi:hypothetical protein